MLITKPSRCFRVQMVTDYVENSTLVVIIVLNSNDSHLYNLYYSKVTLQTYAHSDTNATVAAPYTA